MPDQALVTPPAELIELVREFAPADGVHATPIAGLQLLRLAQPGAPLPALYEPGLVLVVQGRKVATLGTQRLVYDPLHCLVVGVTMLPVAQVIEASPERPYLCMRLQVDAREIGALVLESAGARPAAAPVSGLQVARTSPELLDAALRLLRLLKTPQDAAVLAPLIQREIFYRVLTGELGARLRELSVTDSHAQRIARAIDLLKHRFTESLRVEDVAQAAAMSPSTFHQHFKQLTAMSPLQYQKQLRLHHARQLMLGQGLDAAVAGHRVGYESPSQFSREYRRLFGAPPRAEVRQTQAAVAGGA
ncbi:MAG: AraC family transcriptional regulator [Piscinibacter sp.]|uniref:AraC family transcriptional regulator n=1 Tax=Piscinibacter sp. TaxID=1903157 RepID=UPI001B4E7FEF|nr:AraC family transcriptional regulator [Piscinibacter sp.]MBP5991037.1 AraC family transcriptional regulator [Piscinibacter sp.]MBP6028129.1 AraC family transcriptional regulator [Piscinibacter sp.]